MLFFQIFSNAFEDNEFLLCKNVTYEIARNEEKNNIVFSKNILL